MNAIVRWMAAPADYASTWAAMRAFTDARADATLDEIWICEHSPVYTLGQAAKPEHLLNPKNIGVVQTDRGGQVTYHGPGQIVVYPLVDLRRLGLFVKDYVRLLEDSAIGVLDAYGIAGACRLPGAPGVYVTRADGAPSKIAAVGLKVRRGCAYHGLALNVSMDLSPYGGINPCGMAGLATTDIRTCMTAAAPGITEVGDRLVEGLLTRLYADRSAKTCIPQTSIETAPEHA